MAMDLATLFSAIPISSATKNGETLPWTRYQTCSISSGRSIERNSCVSSSINARRELVRSSSSKVCARLANSTGYSSFFPIESIQRVASFSRYACLHFQEASHFLRRFFTKKGGTHARFSCRRTTCQHDVRVLSHHPRRGKGLHGL